MNNINNYNFNNNSIYQQMFPISELANVGNNVDKEILEIRIPYRHARMEEALPNRDDVTNDIIDCYKLYVVKQYVGKGDVLVFVRMPNDPDNLYGIILYARGGVDWIPEYKKDLYKVTDKIDRRVLIGFCINYHYALTDFAQNGSSYYQRLTGNYSGQYNDNWIRYQAYKYTYKGIKERYAVGRDSSYIDDDSKWIDTNKSNVGIPEYTKFYSMVQRFDNPTARLYNRPYGLRA